MLHLHSPYIRTISGTDSTLHMIDQNSMRFYNRITYHPYEGIVVDYTKSGSLSSKLADKSKDILILKNHGVVILANNVAQAFNTAYYLEIAAETQIRAYEYALASGTKVSEIPQDVVEKTAKKLQGQAEDLFAYFNFESWRKRYNLIPDVVFSNENDKSCKANV